MVVARNSPSTPFVGVRVRKSQVGRRSIEISATRRVVCIIVRSVYGFVCAVNVYFWFRCNDYELLT